MSIEPISREAVSATSSGILPVVIPPPIPEYQYTDYAAIRDDLLVEMDGISDPFEQMMFALMVLMPTILTMQEQDLSSLAHTQKTVNLYGEKLQEVQDYYNQLKTDDYEAAEDPKMHEIAEKLYIAAAQLQQYMELDTVLDDETRALFKEDVDAFVAQFDEYLSFEYGTGDWTAICRAFAGAWDSTIYGSTYNEDHLGDDLLYEYKVDAIQRHNENLGMFQSGASTLSTQSNVVSALVDYDSQHYNSTGALFKDMFKEYYKQVEANIRNFDPMRT